MHDDEQFVCTICSWSSRKIKFIISLSKVLSLNEFGPFVHRSVLSLMTKSEIAVTPETIK